MGDSIDLFLVGPKSKTGWPTCSILLKGEGCREYERRNPDKTWYDFISFFVTILNSTPTRIDLTIDDFDGFYFDLNWLKTKLDKGFFTSTFQKKYYKIHGCNEEGYSIQFGSYSSSQMLVIYEKLKEQTMKKKEVNADYWLRFEMRYMHEKASCVCLDIIDAVDNGSNKIDAFNKYVLSIFYKMLDIKMDNNYQTHDQNKVETDPLWKSFLKNVDKIKINTQKQTKSSFDIYKSHFLNQFYLYFLTIYFLSNKDLNTTLIIMLEDIKSKFDFIDISKIKRINKFLTESSISKINLKDIEPAKTRIINEIDILRLPF